MPNENAFDNYQKLQDKQQLSQAKWEETHFAPLEIQEAKHF